MNEEQIKALIEQGLAGSRVLGFLLTGLSAIALCAFLVYWDLGPF